MRFFRALFVLVLAAWFVLLPGCAKLKVENPGPYPYNSRYG